MFARLLLLSAAASTLLAACTRKPAEDNPAESVARTLAVAWGPEKPEVLQKYLEMRRAMKPIYDRFEEGVTQWSLREASTRPSIAMAVFGVMQLRRTLNEQLAKQGLTDDDYMRLTALVYGRWLRAVREGDPPEKRLLRTLQELAIGAERHLANNPPGEPNERQRLSDRALGSKWQARFVAPFALQDKAQTLARIDKATAAWLEQHRKEVEELDFGLFDTAAPPRTKPAPPKKPAAPPPELPPEPSKN